MALSDAEKVIELKPDFVKGYGRKGAALFGKGEFELAKKAYEDGLKVDAANDTCKDGIKECEQKLSGDDEESKEFTKMFSDPQLLGKLATNPSKGPASSNKLVVWSLSRYQLINAIFSASVSM